MSIDASRIHDLLTPSLYRHGPVAFARDRLGFHADPGQLRAIDPLVRKAAGWLQKLDIAPRGDGHNEISLRMVDSFPETPTMREPFVTDKPGRDHNQYDLVSFMAGGRTHARRDRRFLHARRLS